MGGEAKDKLVISVIRWIGLLPAAFFTNFTSYAISKYLYGFGASRFLDVGSSFYNIISEWACSSISGASAVYIAALIAPTHKKHASIILTIMIINYSIIPYFLMKPDTSYAISSIATIVGAITITVAILYDYIELNKPYTITSDCSSTDYTITNDQVAELATDNTVSSSITMEALVKLETQFSRVLLCPRCGESYPVPTYGKIVMTCYKCKTRFEHG